VDPRGFDPGRFRSDVDDAFTSADERIRARIASAITDIPAASVAPAVGDVRDAYVVPESAPSASRRRSRVALVAVAACAIAVIATGVLLARSRDTSPSWADSQWAMTRTVTGDGGRSVAVVQLDDGRTLRVEGDASLPGTSQPESIGGFAFAELAELPTASQALAAAALVRAGPTAGAAAASVAEIGASGMAPSAIGTVLPGALEALGGHPTEVEGAPMTGDAIGNSEWVVIVDGDRPLAFGRSGADGTWTWVTWQVRE
jgi:hypothetical protein